MKNSKSIEAFENEPIFKLVIKNSIPAMIAMVMVMVYNLADTFFIGLTHDDMQVAAVSIATPVFMIFMSLGTLFGVGGTSVISRALGAKRYDYAKKVSSFCMWACVFTGLLFMIILWVFMDSFIKMLGCSENTFAYTKSYLTIAIGCGVFSMISNCFSNIVRTEGKPMMAMTGTVIGNLINVILDPIMILLLGWGITGAAIATVIGNIVAAMYYLIYFLRGKSALSINIKDFSMKEHIFKDVFMIGLSASLSNLLVSVSSILVNIQLSSYKPNGDMYVAAYGVTSKVLMMVVLIGIGIGSGVQPLIGYLYGAKKKDRLMKSIRYSLLFGTLCCLIVSTLCFIFAGPIVNIFLSKPESFNSSIHFTRILMTTAWLIGAFGVIQSSLQTMGAAISALLASILRQAVIFIPFMYILNALIGLDGLIWAQPVADVLSLIFIIIMLVFKIKNTEFTKAEESIKE